MENDPVEYQYKCDKTGKTYSWDGLNNTVGSIEKADKGGLQVNCSQCGGRHPLDSKIGDASIREPR
jgi:hypothetical protein